MKRRIVALFSILVLLLLTLVPGGRAYASKPLDEILDYEITIDVNEDATLNMHYHIDWKVLDSTSEGPLEWVQIGIPNSHYISCTSDSDSVRSIKATSGSGQYVAKIYFDKKYYKDEVVSFDFDLVQDYMYEMNVLTEGETVYYFTPGWFDGIQVDNVVVRWNTDKAIGNSSGAVVDGDYFVWSGSLSAGEKFKEVSVTYETSAYSFNEDKYAEDYSDYNKSNNGNYNNNYSNSYSSNDYDGPGSAIAGMMVIGFIVFIFAKIGNAIKYSSGSGFKGETKKQIKRTLIKYYPTCPGCGAARPEGKEKCDYCGRSFIESEEVIEEKEIKEPSKYSSEGLFRYGDSPNTYVRVHVTHVPVSRPRSSCVHSSCAHSSCACAHSCACACACACAGGGRAGCSTKDFYNTNLKLKQLQRKKRK
ncbi:hypothetical protein SAMN02910339_01207 [Lachnospiraceae bacterium YSD2013]|nr:hypothetical protein SAMN02910339_01207 [Lachnospiraceae bacterium YSD2013]